MDLVDTVDARPKGRLEITAYRNGEVIDVFSEDNVVVNLSKTTLSRLLGGDVTNRSISKIGFGTSGAAASSGNTSLTGAFVKNVDLVEYPETNQVRFTFSLSSSENNGMAILEFGLLTTGGTLFARRIRTSALNKASDISLTGTWLITF